MCEHFVARAAEPFRLDELWPFTERLERFGIAGFGWGAAWLTRDGGLRSHRDVGAFRDDPARERVGGEETTAVLVHLRRPSRLSTIGLPDAQPFDDPGGRFAFSHNGDLRRIREHRARYRDEGRIHGRADTEVGQRWLEDAWGSEPPAALLCRLHETFGGQANLATLSSDGEALHYAGNDENPVFTFRLGRIGLASTGIYSLDRSVFRFVARDATDRRLVRVRRTVQLRQDGSPSPA
jgi:glutamine phosphoribosylpyrophosphate amidotransferase